MHQTDFVPLPFLRGPHLQTMAGWLTRKEIPIPGTTVVEVPLGDGDFTTAHIHSPSDHPGALPTLILLHGLEGDASRAYMIRIARKAASLGVRTARMNMRCCGDAEGLSAKFYNGAQSKDVTAMARWLRERFPGSPIYLAGFSLGGNLVLKAAGEGEIEGLSGVVAVCPPLEPHRSARAIEHWSNGPYQTRFVISMVERVERHQKRFPHGPRYNLSKRMTVAMFDAAFTVPHGGFESLDHYYEVCSPKNLLSRIECPWLIITSMDDPIVPFESFRGLEDSRSVLAPKHGGHLGFVGYGKPEDPDYRWAENRVVEFFARLTGEKGSS
ncbi:MAG: hypothetical protein GHCLOJNM_04077 [bacterium]|nr:hypothetical protein [bacterium]